ncbi:MAG: hypothetical protein CVT64_11015 [Actinobacteria bacterium HGW-Actinobacteria-4]|nr:MAG: hypothetical protein CVT64_11015 [Actinobacteria bacterium HGW-Actinobacteria-4]
MKALATQFETDRKTSAVATPTCSSCCCCCCCLATVVSTSGVAALRVNAEGQRNGVAIPGVYVLLAALFAPIAVVVGVLVANVVPLVPGVCAGGFDSYGNGYARGCVVEPGFAGLIAGVIAAGVILWLTFRGARVSNRWGRLGSLYALFIVGFVIEFVVGGFLLLSLAYGGIIVYMVVAGAAAVGVLVAYNRRLSRENALLGWPVATYPPLPPDPDPAERPTPTFLPDPDIPGLADLPDTPEPPPSPPEPPRSQ